jgi:hypothetical protein
VEVILFVLIVLGVCFACWRRRIRRYEQVQRTSSPRQPPIGQPPVTLPRQPPIGQPPIILGNRQDFSELRSILEELADRGWSKNRSSWDSNFSLNPSEFPSAIELDQVVRILLNHARKVAPEFSVPSYVPQTISSPTLFAAGQFEVDEEGWVTIRVSPDFFNDRPAAQAILAHEACHYILEQSGIRQPDFQLNERYTDLCMFICGFGQTFLQGYKRELAQNQLRPGHRLGYLTDVEYGFANQYVVQLRQSREATLRSELDEVKRRLMQLLHGDEGAYRRIIEAERRRNPHASEVDLHRAEIDRRERGR